MENNCTYRIIYRSSGEFLFDNSKHFRMSTLITCTHGRNYLGARGVKPEKITRISKCKETFENE